MKFPRRLFESERGGSNAGGLLFAVAFLKGVFARVNQTAHGERLFARVHNRDFRIDPKARVATLARYGAGKAQRPFAAAFWGRQQQPRYLSIKDQFVVRPKCALACLSVSANFSPTPSGG
jgi:hypothetical protein